MISDAGIEFLKRIREISTNRNVFDFFRLLRQMCDSPHYQSFDNVFIYHQSRWRDDGKAFEPLNKLHASLCPLLRLSHTMWVPSMCVFPFNLFTWAKEWYREWKFRWNSYYYSMNWQRYFFYYYLLQRWKNSIAINGQQQWNEQPFEMICEECAHARPASVQR